MFEKTKHVGPCVNVFHQYSIECISYYLLPTGSEEREVLGAGSIPVATLPSCQDMISFHYNCTDMYIVG